MMTQRDRDRLVVLKKVDKKLIQQRQAAEEMGVTPRQVKRLLKRLREQGDSAVVHGLRGRPSPRRLAEWMRAEAVQILRRDYPGLGPTLASEYLRQKHGLAMGR
jgi:transposase